MTPICQICQSFHSPKFLVLQYELLSAVADNFEWPHTVNYHRLLSTLYYYAVATGHLWLLVIQALNTGDRAYVHGNSTVAIVNYSYISSWVNYHRLLSTLYYYAVATGHLWLLVIQALNTGDRAYVHGNL